MQASPMLAYNWRDDPDYPLMEAGHHNEINEQPAMVVEQCGCFTKDVNGNIIINDCCAQYHTLNVDPGWTDITPKSRHGEVVSRDIIIAEEESIVQCLVVQPDYQNNRDVAFIESLYLSSLPYSHRKHELASVCIAQEINEILIEHESDPSLWRKVLYMGDRIEWSEPQARAVALLMHAFIIPAGLHSIREHKDLANAEQFAEHYCRSVGLNRIDLPNFHSCGSPTRITRVDTEHIKRKAPAVSFYNHRDISPNTVYVRQDSQTPIKSVVETIEISHGGIEQTVVVDRYGNRHELGDRFGSNDLHMLSENCPDSSAEKLIKKKNKKQKKKEKKAKKAAKKAAKDSSHGSPKDSKKRRKHRRRRTTPKVVEETVIIVDDHAVQDIVIVDEYPSHNHSNQSHAAPILSAKYIDIGSPVTVQTYDTYRGLSGSRQTSAVVNPAILSRGSSPFAPAQIRW